MANPTKKSKARKPIDYGEGTPVITQVVTRPGEIVKPVGHPLLRAGIAEIQAKSPRVKSRDELKARPPRKSRTRRQRYFARALTSARRARSLRKQEPEVLHKLRQFQPGPEFMQMFEAWRPDDQKGWKILIETLAKNFYAWLAGNQDLVKEFTPAQPLVTWQLGKALAFKRYGVSDEVFNAIYLKWLFEGAKPRGFKALIEKEEEGKGGPLLLADRTLQKVHGSLSEKQAWELATKFARDFQTFDGYVWTSFRNAISEALKAKDPHIYFPSAESIDRLILKTIYQKSFEESPEDRLISLEEEKPGELRKRLLNFFPEVQLKNVLILKYQFKLTQKEIAVRIGRSTRMIRIYQEKIDQRIDEFKKTLKK